MVGFDYRAIGNKLILGTGQLGLHGTREDAYRLLDAYVDLGGEVIDTAEMYSDWVPGEGHRSENVIGEWLASRRSRDGVRIVTKGGHPPHDDMSQGRLDPLSLRTDVEGSLKRMGIDHIDLYFLHRDDRAVPVAEIMGALEPFVAAGQIGSVGCSNWDIDRLDEVSRLSGLKPVSNQLLGNVLSNVMSPPDDTTTRVLDTAAFRQAEAHDWSLFLFTSQAMGALSKWRRQDRRVVHTYDNPQSLAVIAALTNLADARGIDENHLALAFLMAFSPRMFPIVGANTIAQLEQSMQASAVTLDAETMASIARITGFDAFPA